MGTTQKNSEEGENVPFPNPILSMNYYLLKLRKGLKPKISVTQNSKTTGIQTFLVKYTTHNDCALKPATTKKY